MTERETSAMTHLGKPHHSAGHGHPSHPSTWSVVCLSVFAWGCATTELPVGSPDAGPIPDLAADAGALDAALDAPVTDGALDLGDPDLPEPCGGDDCSDLDGVCVVGECDPVADVCVAVPRPEDTPCDDGRACTEDDFCVRGVCAGRGPDCSDLDSACTVGLCDDATGGCVAQPLPDGSACEDGDLCIVGDTCQRGTCRSGAPLDCTRVADGCNVSACNPLLGVCEATPLADGTVCEDGLACTEGDECAAGRCVPGARIDCSAFGDTCLVGTCDEATGGCVSTPERDGTLCDDGDDCTLGDACMMGACGSGPREIPLGDTCGSPIALASRDGFQLGASSTVCASNSQEGTCGGLGGEVFYSLALTAPRFVRLETVAAGMTFDTTLYVREDCGVPATQVACDDDGGPGAFSLIGRVLQPGSYAIAIDGSGAGDAGFFTLQVNVTTPDTCASAVPLELPALGTPLSISSTTASRTRNALTSTCGGSARSPEHIYELSLATRTTLRFETVAPTGYDTVLHVRRAPCATGRTLFCDDDDGSGTLSLIEETFDPGTYFLAVDGFGSGERGEYTLEVERL